MPGRVTVKMDNETLLDVTVTYLVQHMFLDAGVMPHHDYIIELDGVKVYDSRAERKNNDREDVEEI